MSERPVYVFSSNRLGNGPEELGDILMRGFFRTLTKVEPVPQVLIFINTGVELLTKQDIRENLDILKEKGIKVLACGTCLDFFNLKEQVEPEYISNMAEILTTMANSSKVINL